MIGGCSIRTLAERFGTPLYLFDRVTLDAAAAEYRETLRMAYPGATAVTYAGKAYLGRAMAQWTQRQGFWLDCTGAGEIAIAVAAGVPPERLLVHGVNKSREDLAAAITHAGVVVVDNLNELALLGAMAADVLQRPEVWLRIRPGVAVDTHAYRQTGQEDSKFGMSLDEATQAVHSCAEQGLALTGLHFHQGSHFHDPAPIGPAIATVLDLMARLKERTGWAPAVLSPGGGWGVPYHEDDLPHPAIRTYVEFVATAVAAGCEERQLALPRLQLEPGRSLVAQAGVAVYRVGGEKHTANRRWILIDGGLADNPRPALYQARYSALPVTEPARPAAGAAWIAGPFCESGDVLIEELPLPAMAAGELLAVPAAGAYQLAMGSNYNGARKPVVLLAAAGEVQVMQRRETVADLLRRDEAVEW
jgi:diaminopimelate decarboxylase